MDAIPGHRSDPLSGHRPDKLSGHRPDKLSGHRPDPGLFIKRYARCASPGGEYSSLFFSEEPLDIARAKAVCRPCLAREHCLALAIARAEPVGVWGGEIFVDGVPVAEKRRRGRPPRVPRPELVVNEIPDVA